MNDSPLRHRMHRLMAASFAVALGLPVTGLLADAITRKGITYKPVTIADIKDGEVIYNTLGQERKLKVEEVDAIEVDTLPDLAKADDLASKEKWSSAANLYRAAGRKAKKPWQENWAQRKLVISLDRAGSYESALKEYAKLLQKDDSEFAVEVFPKNLPQDLSKLKDLKKDAEDLKGRIHNAKAKTYFDKLIAALASVDTENAKPTSDRRPPDGKPEGAAPVIKIDINTPDPTKARNNEEGSEVGELIQAGKFEEALKAIEPKLKAKTTAMSRLLFYQGKAEAALGRDMDAAVSLMRVIVHYPDDKWSVDSRIEAGKLFKKLGNESHAKALWAEAKDLAHNDPDKLKELTQLLASVGG